ncbi:hypothetical protein LOD99_241 [Oopsacas minuta]|uniref:Uncharacterized protein n=1 Tax=Oopsacas minuta TaxID=111878 RepID=A0AAV7K9F2_9METZ|nr:hypothetical protein LOD99_241 [Oopsacas minuta]
MSTFDIDPPEEVWPVGTRKRIGTVKTDLLRLKKKSIEETKKLNIPLNKSIITMEKSIFSAPSINFLDATIDAQFDSSEKKSKRIREPGDLASCVKLEILINQLLRVILKDTYTKLSKRQFDEMHQELIQLFNTLIETQPQGSIPVEYSPRLEAVLSRIAVSGLITLDSSNGTVEFEF